MFFSEHRWMLPYAMMLSRVLWLACTCFFFYSPPECHYWSWVQWTKWRPNCSIIVEYFFMYTFFYLFWVRESTYLHFNTWLYDRPLFASSLLSIIQTLLDQARQDDIQIIGCETLFDFVNNQVGGLFLFSNQLQILITKTLDLSVTFADRWSLHV